MKPRKREGRERAATAGRERSAPRAATMKATDWLRKEEEWRSSSSASDSCTRRSEEGEGRGREGQQRTAKHHYWWRTGSTQLDSSRCGLRGSASTLFSAKSSSASSSNPFLLFRSTSGDLKGWNLCCVCVVEGEKLRSMA